MVIPTDVGGEHAERARPFIEEGIPVFIDKPLTDNGADLQKFVKWRREGRALMSTSCMRYARQFHALREGMPTVGDARLVICTMMKSWERYGIHAIESVYGLARPGGWQDVVNTGEGHRNVVHLRHADGMDVLLPVIGDMAGGFGHLSLFGTRGSLRAEFADTFSAFKAQLTAWVEFLRTGVSPVPFDQTVEQMKILIAGIRSRNEHGRRVPVSEIDV